MNTDNDYVIVYRDGAGDWRWHRQDKANGKIVSESGEGYVAMADAFDAAQELNPDVPIEVDD